MLFIVPTPIGNLGDITLRALDVLKKADMILAEDTRTSAVLLKKYQINTPMQSYHTFNEHQSVGRIAEKINSGMTLALISDAGTPGISDPGFLLVRECLKLGLKVECLPGATAFVPALISSGLPCDRFCFEGFLPAKKGRSTRLKILAQEERTLVFYESPHRVVKTIKDLINHLGGDRRASISRELTKIYEEVLRGDLDTLLGVITAKSPKGEFVIVVQGKN